MISFFKKIFSGKNSEDAEFNKVYSRSIFGNLKAAADSLEELKKKVDKQNQKTHILHPKDIATGQKIHIEWYKFKAKVGPVECISNDTQGRKVFVKVTWSNYEEAGVPEKEYYVFDYADSVFKNFHVLNMHLLKTKEKSDDISSVAKKAVDAINELNEKKEAAIEQENYEQADIINKKIEEIKSILWKP